MSNNMGDVILEIKDISKSFSGGVKALNNVSFDLKMGEIHCIVGENGAGKSTFIKIISGVMHPDCGQISILGQKVKALDPKTSKNLGIQTIYQEPILSDTVTVAENIFCGFEKVKGAVVPLIDWKKLNAAAEEILRFLNSDIKPTEIVRRLGIAERQTVQIARAMAQSPKILIMDEPTASYGKDEVDKLLRIVENIRDHGVSIIYISHHMEEIFDIGDRVTVLRDGEKINTHKISEIDNEQLIREMVGRSASAFYNRERVPIGDVIFQAEKICGNGVTDVSFNVRQGEILGIGGLVGSKRTEMVKLIAGAGKVKSGSFIYQGVSFIPHEPKDAIKKGICLITEDRQKSGLFLNRNIRENITIANLKKIKGFLIKSSHENECAQDYVNRLKIKISGLNQYVRNLSGGNQQKVVLAKWLFREPKLLILDEPTRGIDIGAKEELYKIMVEFVKSGKSIIMVSSDMPELLSISDRIIVLSKGKLTGEIQTNEASEEKILKMSLGGSI